jgi:DNA-binding XRE family transcriptional regulator
MTKKIKRTFRESSVEDHARHAKVREEAMRQYPPMPSRLVPAPPGIPSRIHAARLAQGLTWYALAKKAGVPNQATVRDIEQGKDVKLSNLEAVAAALGLQLELVEQ